MGILGKDYGDNIREIVVRIVGLSYYKYSNCGKEGRSNDYI